MDVRLFLLADFANVDASNKLNIIGAFNRLNADQLPFIHPALFLVIRISAELGEFEQQRTLKVILFDEDGGEVWQTPDVNFTMHTPKDGHVGEFNPVIGIQRAKFDKAGRYEYRVFINGDSKGVAPLDVVLRPQQPAE